MASKKNINAAAKRLREAELNSKTCAPVRDLIGETDMVSAYKVQEINTALRIKEGARVIGSKIGLTAPVVQKQFGIDQPDFGRLWDDKEIANGGELSVTEVMQGRVEVELGFVLGRDLNQGSMTSVDVISAVDYVLPCIEVVGSRIKDWNIKITDTIADNASASHWVIGHKPTRLHDIDLLNCKMVMKNKNKIVSKGVGKNCLGSPINAVLWLAKKMQSIGQPLKAGDLILSGALGPMVSISSGDHYMASIEGAGEVSVRFTD